jgi:D-arabinose 5-phosphate isomerase GutQ
MSVSVERAKRVLKIEADAIRCLRDKIDENFEKAMELMYHCRGKVVVMGVGKSGIIAKKIASRAVQKMEEYSITSLFVFKGGEDRTPVGIFHLHDLLKSGIIS